MKQTNTISIDSLAKRKAIRDIMKECDSNGLRVLINTLFDTTCKKRSIKS